MSLVRCSALALLLTACGGATAPVAPPAEARPAAPSVTIESPARWVSFPQTVGVALATLILPDGRCLVTTDDGERWLITAKDKAKPCIGSGSASGSPSLEPLVGAQRVGDEYRFVAEGGIVYTAKQAHGPFTKYVRAPLRLKRVAAAGNAIVGVDDAGGTHFYDGAWKRSTMPADAYGLDVGIDQSGRALWIGAPERLMLSVDAGQTFKLLADAPRVGAYEVGFSQKGELAAKGVIGNLVIEGERATRTQERLRETEGGDVEIEPSEGPRASLLQEQRAALHGSSYLEILEPFDGTRYGLGRAQLGQPLAREALTSFEACDNLKVTGAGELLAITCVKQVDDKPNLSAEVWIATDGKVASLERIASLVTPSFSDVSIAAASDGSVIVLGACKDAPAPADGAAEKPKRKDPPKKLGLSNKKRGPQNPDVCSPKGPIWLKKSVITVGAAQGLEEGSARSPLLSPDGHTAYFVGMTRREGKPAIFVSKDGGKTYQPRVIDAPQASSWDSDDMDEGPGHYERAFYIPEQARLTTDETGTLGITAEREMGFSWVTFDSEGRVANVSDPPEPSTTVGGVGNRVVALAYGQMDGALRSWESLDGGATWAEITTTQAVERYGGRGGGAVYCAQAGCLLGEELARVGWEGQAEAAFTMTEDDPPDPREVTLGQAIVCQLTPKTEWVEIEGRPEERAGTTFSPYSTTPAWPRLSEIMRGKTAFSIATISVEDQSVEVLSAQLGDKASLGKRVLLGPTKSKAGSVGATVLRSETEGLLAMRAEVPLAKQGGVDLTRKMEGLTVAWENPFLGVSGKRTVKLDQSWTSSMLSGQTLRPATLALAGSAALVQPFANSKATLLDHKSLFTFDLPGSGQLATDARGVGQVDPLFVSGSLFSAALLERAPTASIFSATKAALKEPPKGATAPAVRYASTIAPGGAELYWSYAADRVAVIAAQASPGAPARATGFVLDDSGELGPALDLPTLNDLPARPKSCSSEQRKSVRVVSAQLGRYGVLQHERGRHPVVVSEASQPTPSTSLVGPAQPNDPVWLLTDGAVLHGSKKEPCVAGFRASGLRPGSVAILGGDLEHSFFLRLSSGMRKRKAKGASSQWGQFIQVRPMTCKYQSDLSLPNEVASRAGHRMSDDLPRTSP